MPRLRTLTPSASPLHFFGSEVRRAREAAGMSQSELGDLVPCDKATVSRTEAGLTQPDEAFARACDAAFAHLDGWFTRFHTGSRTWGEAFPPAFRPFAVCEAEAVALRWFEHALVPGLLQTEDYARAILETHPNTSRAQFDERLAARMGRQAIFDREDPPVFWVLLDEAVLHRKIGGTAVMRDQLLHVIDMAQRPNITVQVIAGLGAHPGLSGAFGIAEMSDRHCVVYLETVGNGQTTEDPGNVADVRLLFDTLRTEACKGSESLALIESAAEQWKP
jgi:transcriptional regulator with XRE-family HTH domain